MQSHIPQNEAATKPAAVQRKMQNESPLEVMQRVQPLEEEELLQGKFATAQRMQPLEEEELLQGKFQPIQRQPNNTGLPDNLKSGVENLSGYSMDDVKVHYNSDQPAQLNAHAYAQGTDIHLASGQEKHLPHEAWHVVQQKQGRVRPTMQMKGKVNINDDVGLEREADVMGVQALRQATPNYPALKENNPVGAPAQLLVEEIKVKARRPELLIEQKKLLEEIEAYNTARISSYGDHTKDNLDRLDEKIKGLRECLQTYEKRHREITRKATSEQAVVISKSVEDEAERLLKLRNGENIVDDNWASTVQEKENKGKLELAIVTYVSRRQEKYTKWFKSKFEPGRFRSDAYKAFYKELLGDIGTKLKEETFKELGAIQSGTSKQLGPASEAWVKLVIPQQAKKEGEALLEDSLHLLSRRYAQQLAEVNKFELYRITLPTAKTGSAKSKEPKDFDEIVKRAYHKNLKTVSEKWRDRKAHVLYSKYGKDISQEKEEDVKEVEEAQEKLQEITTKTINEDKLGRKVLNTTIKSETTEGALGALMSAIDKTIASRGEKLSVEAKLLITIPTPVPGYIELSISGQAAKGIAGFMTSGIPQVAQNENHLEVSLAVGVEPGVKVPKVFSVGIGYQRTIRAGADGLDKVRMAFSYTLYRSMAAAVPDFAAWFYTLGHGDTKGENLFWAETKAAFMEEQVFEGDEEAYADALHTAKLTGSLGPDLGKMGGVSIDLEAYVERITRYAAPDQEATDEKSQREQRLFAKPPSPNDKKDLKERTENRGKYHYGVGGSIGVSVSAGGVGVDGKLKLSGEYPLTKNWGAEITGAFGFEGVGETGALIAGLTQQGLGGVLTISNHISRLKRAEEKDVVDSTYSGGQDILLAGAFAELSVLANSDSFKALQAANWSEELKSVVTNGGELELDKRSLDLTKLLESKVGLELFINFGLNNGTFNFRCVIYSTRGIEFNIGTKDVVGYSQTYTSGKPIAWLEYEQGAGWSISLGESPLRKQNRVHPEPVEATGLQQLSDGGTAFLPEEGDAAPPPTLDERSFRVAANSILTLIRFAKEPDETIKLQRGIPIQQEVERNWFLIRSVNRKAVVNTHPDKTGTPDSAEDYYKVIKAWDNLNAIKLGAGDLEDVSPPDQQEATPSFTAATPMLTAEPEPNPDPTTWEVAEVKAGDQLFHNTNKSAVVDILTNGIREVKSEWVKPLLGEGLYTSKVQSGADAYSKDFTIHFKAKSDLQGRVVPRPYTINDRISSIDYRAGNDFLTNPDDLNEIKLHDGKKVEANEVDGLRGDVPLTYLSKDAFLSNFVKT